MRVAESLKNRWIILTYRFKHWFFQWKLENEGDVALVIAGRMALVKYKEHTVICFGNFSHWRDAPKYLTTE